MNKINKKLLSAIGLSLACMVLAFDVLAGTGGSYFDAFYSELVGWLDGAPGKSLMVLMFIAAGYFGVVEPNFLRCAGSVLFGLVFMNAQTLIEAFLSASISATPIM